MKIPQWSTDEDNAHVIDEVQEFEILKVEEWMTEKEDSHVVEEVYKFHCEFDELIVAGIGLRLMFCGLSVDFKNCVRCRIYIFLPNAFPSHFPHSDGVT
jgi:hypothetical protein